MIELNVRVHLYLAWHVGFDLLHSAVSGVWPQLKNAAFINISSVCSEFARL